MNLNKFVTECSHMTFCIETLGCKANQYDAQSIREQLLARGYSEVKWPQPANVYIINTCTVTQTSDRKCLHRIKQAVGLIPRPKIIVTGCYAHTGRKELEQIKGLDYIFTNEQKDTIAETVAAVDKHSGTSVSETPPDAGKHGLTGRISDFEGHNRAFIKVQDGCESFCTYCIVPHFRGKNRSKKLKTVLEEATALSEKGFKEIVLSGIHLGNYGKDLDNSLTLAGLIDELEKIKGLLRIRLSSIEPLEVTQELIDSIKKSRKVCHHLHLPLQSGDAKILKRMNRPYTPEQYLAKIEKIQAHIKDVALTTDVMVGFPGEDASAFGNTLGMIEKAGFSRIHAFGFSPRPGTPAYDFKDRVPEAISSQRINQVKELALETSLKYRRLFLKKTVYPLIESKRDKKTGLLTGYTDTYIRVLMEGEDSLQNDIVAAKVTEVTPERTVVEYARKIT